MNKKRLGIAGVVAAAALAVSTLAAPTASAATQIIVWADETRGPNLEKTFAKKSDWVPGYTIKVVTFSSYKALGDALDKATGTSGPDIFVGGNDWVVASAKSGKLAPVTLTASQKAQFTSSQIYDLSYAGKLYGVPLDINNVAMIFNTKLVKTAPKTFGDMVDFYQANKASMGLKNGLCVTGGGMSWGALSVFSALGAQPYLMLSNGKVDVNRGFNPTKFAANVNKYLIDPTTKKSNGFWASSNTTCNDDFYAGKVPYSIIGNWEWKTYVDKGFAMNLQPVPSVDGGYGKMFGSVSGAFLTSFAEKHGTAVGAKSLLTNFFGSTAGQVAYGANEGRPPAAKGAQSDPSVAPGQKNMGAVATLAGIPQVGAILDAKAGGSNYWDSSGDFWTQILVNGKDAYQESKKMAAIWKANVTSVASLV
jgi:arabinogalactan oligomer/maltooligosaccharide transport system substrate-binding protein